MRGLTTPRAKLLALAVVAAFGGRPALLVGGRAPSLPVTPAPPLPGLIWGYNYDRSIT